MFKTNRNNFYLNTIQYNLEELEDLANQSSKKKAELAVVLDFKTRVAELRARRQREGSASLFIYQAA